MSFSYLGAGSSAKDAVRFRIGDTVEKLQAISDEDILFLLEENEGDVLGASIDALRSLIAKYSFMCDQTVGSVSKSYSQIRANFKETLSMLAANRTSVRGLPIAGGLSKTGTIRTYANADFKKPRFTRDSFVLKNSGRVSASGISRLRDDNAIYGRES